MGHEKRIQDFSQKTRMEDLHAEGILLKWILIECEDVDLIHRTGDVAHMSDRFERQPGYIKGKKFID
jgi:hypothetical protein